MPQFFTLVFAAVAAAAGAAAAEAAVGVPLRIGALPALGTTL